MTDSKTLGAIDIGSNAIRLLISNVDTSNGVCEFKKAAFLRVPIRLGADTFTKGEISKNNEFRLNEAMKGFSHIMNAYGVSQYLACATSAMREATNGKEVVGSIFKDSGIDIKIITGKEEAEMIFEAGAIDTILDQSKNYLYVDVGGGSTELVLYSNKQKIDSRSFGIGTVRILENAVKKDEKTAFKTWLENAYSEYAPLSIIASGGNINKVAKLLSKKDFLQYSDIKSLYSKLKDLNYEERMQKFKLNTYRADVIIPALKIFIDVAKICKITDIYAPKIGLVDGIVHHLYSQSNNSIK